jgi:hypothetical protein
LKSQVGGEWEKGWGGLSRLVRDPYLEERAARATGKGIDEFLAQVPSAEAPEWDKVPEGYERK